MRRLRRYIRKRRWFYHINRATRRAIRRARHLDKAEMLKEEGRRDA